MDGKIERADSQAPPQQGIGSTGGQIETRNIFMAIGIGTQTDDLIF